MSRQLVPLGLLLLPLLSCQRGPLLEVHAVTTDPVTEVDVVAALPPTFSWRFREPVAEVVRFRLPPIAAPATLHLAVGGRDARGRLLQVALAEQELQADDSSVDVPLQLKLLDEPVPQPSCTEGPLGGPGPRQGERCPAEVGPPEIWNLTPPDASTLGRRADGSQAELRILGWGFHPEVSVSIGEKTAVLRQQTSTELLVDAPTPNHGPTEVLVQVVNPCKVCTWARKFQYFAGTLDFDRREFASGMRPRALVLAQLDGDGAPDIAMSSEADGAVSVLLSADGGAFAKARLVRFPLRLNGLAAADLNDDGHVDLAVLDRSALDGPKTEVVFLWGDGRGQLTRAPESLEGGAEAKGILAADLDGDGRLELVMAASRGGELRVFRNLGGGRFAAPEIYSVSFGMTIAAGDLDGNGWQDLVVGREVSKVSVLMNPGPGQRLQDPVNIESDREVSAVVLADLNLDRRLDIALASQATGQVRVLLNKGAEGFDTDERRRYPALPPPLEHAPGVTYDGEDLLVGLAAADINGDKRTDLVVSSNASSSVLLLLNQDGSLLTMAPRTWDAGRRSAAIAAGDLDGDGRLDLALAAHRDALLVTLRNLAR